MVFRHPSPKGLRNTKYTTRHRENKLEIPRQQITGGDDVPKNSDSIENPTHTSPAPYTRLPPHMPKGKTCQTKPNLTLLTWKSLLEPSLRMLGEKAPQFSHLLQAPIDLMSPSTS